MSPYPLHASSESVVVCYHARNTAPGSPATIHNAIRRHETARQTSAGAQARYVRRGIEDRHAVASLRASVPWLLTGSVHGPEHRRCHPDQGGAVAQRLQCLEQYTGLEAHTGPP